MTQTAHTASPLRRWLTPTPLVAGVLLGVALTLAGSYGMSTYLDFVRRAKPSPALYWVSQVAHLEEDYRARTGRYLACGPTPQALPSPDSAARWTGDACFRELGFAPNAALDCSLAVVTFGEHEYVVLGAVPFGDRVVVYALPRGGRIHVLSGEQPLTWGVVSRERLGELHWPEPE